MKDRLLLFDESVYWETVDSRAFGFFQIVETPIEFWRKLSPSLGECGPSQVLPDPFAPILPSLAAKSPLRS